MARVQICTLLGLLVLTGGCSQHHHTYQPKQQQQPLSLVRMFPLSTPEAYSYSIAQEQEQQAKPSAPTPSTDPPVPVPLNGFSGLLSAVIALGFMWHLKRKVHQ